MRARFFRDLQRRWRHFAFRRPRFPRAAVRNVAVVWLVAALGLLVGIGLRIYVGMGMSFPEAFRGEGWVEWRQDLVRIGQVIPETVVSVTGHPSWEEAAVEAALPRSFRDDGTAGGGASPWRRMVQYGLSIMLGYDVSDNEATVAMSVARFDSLPPTPSTGTISGQHPEPTPAPATPTKADAPPAVRTEGERRTPAGPPPPTPPTVSVRPDATPEPQQRAGGEEEARTAMAGGRPSVARGVGDLDRLREVSRENLAAPFLSPSGTCRVLLFHTHTSETYRTDAVDGAGEEEYHVWNTPESGIVQVGRALALTLEDKYAVPTCHLTDIHDWPSHARAYIESRETVAAFLRRYPQIELVVDLHRDAPPELVTTIAGRSVARIAVVVGTHPTLHPEADTNVALAGHIGQLLEQKYPGVFRQVIERPDARFNQDLHPRMVLLEVGSYDTHLDTALATVDVLADVLADAVYGIRTETLAGVGSPR